MTDKYYVEHTKDPQEASVIKYSPGVGKIEMSFSQKQSKEIYNLGYKSFHNSTFYIEVDDGIVIIKEGGGYYLHNLEKSSVMDNGLFHYYPVNPEKVEVDETGYYRLSSF